mgnify:CR=1 FL=1
MMDWTQRKVLVTGAAGYIGSYLLPAFRERYALTLLDRSAEREGEPVAGVSEPA